MKTLISALLFLPLTAWGALGTFAGDGNGNWEWLPDGRGTLYLSGTFGGGGVTVQGCYVDSTGTGAAVTSGDAAITSDAVTPIVLQGPGWVRAVLASSTTPDLDYEIRPAAIGRDDDTINSLAYDCE